jgi:Ca-activated chloride channel homolog
MAEGVPQPGTRATLQSRGGIYQVLRLPCSDTIGVEGVSRGNPTGAGGRGVFPRLRSPQGPLLMIGREAGRKCGGILGALALFCFCAGSLGLAAQTLSSTSQAQSNPGAQIQVRKPPIYTSPFHVNVNRVLVNVTVTDPYGRIVTGLDKSNFEVADDKVQQKILSFNNTDAPISVGLIFDSSGSMSDKIQKSKEAAMQFFQTSNPQDEFMVINFSERPNLISGFTSRFQNLQDRLLFVKSGGRTALLDAIYLGMSEMKKATTDRKALLVISDGGENHSRYTVRDIKEMVKESDVVIYAIGIFEPLSSRDRTPEEAAGPSLLSDLASMTGGRLFAVEDPDELPDIAEKISIELRNEYVIGYKPSNLIPDGKWHRIKVKLNPPRGLPPLQVYARTGYYAPTN